jgi:hypothetical protein
MSTGGFAINRDIFPSLADFRTRKKQPHRETPQAIVGTVVVLGTIRMAVAGCGMHAMGRIRVK